MKAYLSAEHCDHAECGCPLAALAPELARADHSVNADIACSPFQIVGREPPDLC